MKQISSSNHFIVKRSSFRGFFHFFIQHEKKTVRFTALVIIVEIIQWNSSVLQKEGGEAFSQTILDEHANKAENWHRDAAVKARYTQPAQPITCATFAQDVLEGRAKVSQAHDHKHVPMTFGPASLVGGSLTSERERMRAQVP